MKQNKNHTIPQQPAITSHAPPESPAQPKTLPEFLETIPDCRRGQGRMHRLSTILLLVLMATMSGYHGQRATGDFVQKHRTTLAKALRPKNDKLPYYQTIARVMQQLDYAQFSQVFFTWPKTVISIEDKD